MGQDIHLFVEFRDQEGVWHEVKGPSNAPLQPRFYPPGPSFCDGSWWDARNYYINSILCPTGGRARGIFGGELIPERGVPADVSPTVREYVDHYGTDGHSHTWMTVREAFTLPYHEHDDGGRFDAWLRFLDAIDLYVGLEARLVIFLDN